MVTVLTFIRDFMLALFLVGMAWLLYSHPYALPVYLGVCAGGAAIGYVLWRRRRHAVRQASRGSRVGLDLDRP